MTSGTPEPTEAAKERSPHAVSGRPPRASWLAWVVIPVVVLTLGSTLDAVDHSAPEGAGGTASRYVPPDGHRSVTVDAGGVQSVSESSRLIGIEGLLTAPPPVAATVLDVFGADDVARAQWWRSSTVSDNGQQGADLYRLSEAGVEQVASWGGPLGFVFTPALTILPAEVQPGDTWEVSGNALPAGILTYRASFAALVAEGPFTDLSGAEIPLTGGCLGIENDIVIENADASFVATIAESTVWCPGRGAVWSSGTVNDQPSGRFEVRPGALSFETTDARPAPSLPDTLESTSRLLPGRELPLTVSDPFFGTSAVSGQYPLPPSVTADGKLVTVNDQGDDLQVWSLDRVSASLAWFGHPGSTIVAVGTAGDLVVATTAQRRVVAYDGDGRRVWSWGADELIFAPPVAIANPEGAPDVLVAARSGTISRLDAEQGIPLWSQSIGADARAPVLVVGDLIIVADERDRLTALDAETGSVQWQSDGGAVTRMDASGSTDVVVTMLESGALVGLDAARGVEIWRTAVAGTANDLLVMRDAVVVMTDELTVAVDALSGGVVWRAPGGVALIGDDDAAVLTLLMPTAIELREANTGALIDRQENDASPPSSSVFAVPVGEAVVVLESSGVLRRWELRDEGVTR